MLLNDCVTGKENIMLPLVILTGPTAVGKTDLSVQLAERINGEIISADALQVYKYMDIGTAKVTKDEMRGIMHHLIDVLEPAADFSAAVFKSMANDAVRDICGRGKIPIITGGTGFYIQAVLYDIDFENENNVNNKSSIVNQSNVDNQSNIDNNRYLSDADIAERPQVSNRIQKKIDKLLTEEGLDVKSTEDISKAIREKFNVLLEKHGNEYVHELLKSVDEESSDKIHPNNAQRVIRALEYCYSTGEKFSDYNARQKRRQPAYNFAYFVLNDDRDRLYERINRRVDIMFDKGLTDEMDKLINMGVTKDNQSMQAIGYRELFDYREGFRSLEDTKELIKKNSRNYAKRQLTWFRRERDTEWINYPEFDYSKEKILDYIESNLKNKKIIN